MPGVTPTIWWLDSTDYSLINQEEVMARYDYTSHAQIYDSELFIPFVRVDIIALELEYLQIFFPRHRKMVGKTNTDVEFKRLIESQHSIQHWRAFEEKALKDAIVLWCQENRIPYC